jgi:hypothetical protein
MKKKSKQRGAINYDERLGQGSAIKSMNEDVSIMDDSKACSGPQTDKNEVELTVKDASMGDFPQDCRKVLDHVANDISGHLRRIKDTVHSIERSSIVTEIYARESLVELSILVSLKKGLADIEEYVGQQQYIMLEMGGYCHHLYYNEPGGADFMRKEIEDLANQI